MDTLNWQYFDWKEFQTLCIGIAEMAVPECDFSEHLKPGHKQEGIDLLAFKRNEGKFFCIQCKREKSLSQSALQELISEFLSGDYLEISSDFLLMTSADLQNPALQKFINNKKVELKGKYEIIFQCWDINHIQKKLRDRFDLVAKYFGEAQAIAFCNPQLRYDRIEKMESMPNYIPRKLTHFIEKHSDAKYLWSGSSVTKYELLDLLIQNRATSCKICIIGDAYQGKTSYIKQTVVELQKNHLHIQPIFIQIKEYNVQPISELLTKIYGEWRNIPGRDLILIIDGLDEVPSEKFTEMITHIKEFNLSYCSVSILFSCRRLFFAKYNVTSYLPDFDIYDLYDILHTDVDWYINAVLGDSTAAFYTAAHLAGISDFLFHPFYLVNIVKNFIEPPHQLPSSKIAVIDSLIDSSFNKTKYRIVKGSESVNDEVCHFNNVVEQFAFALQLAGVNSLDNANVAQLFTTDERLLLQHNSLITHTGDSWSFANALFQEHIAARKLAKLNFEEIVLHCTVGYSIKKIKTKWIQTIASMLSILEPQDSLFDKIFKLVENDNIELLFQTEPSKFDDSIKLLILQKLLDKCIQYNTRTITIYEDTVGHFIQQAHQCKEYILNLLYKRELTYRIRVVCCRILRYSMLSESQQQQFADFMLLELSSLDDAYYAATLLNVIGTHKFGNAELITELLCYEKLNEQHEYRSAVYELVTLLNLSDRFYSYGLKGLPYLKKHNSAIHHGGSEKSLFSFFLSSDNPTNLSKLLPLIKSNDWTEYFKRNSITGKDFIKELLDKLAPLYDSYPYMIFGIAELILQLGKNYLREEFNEIDEFLEKTNSHSMVVRILIDNIFNNNDWEIGSLITHEIYDYLLFEYELGGYNNKHLWNCINGLRYKHKNEIADNFYNLCIEATEGTIIVKYEGTYDNSYHVAETIRNENDLVYIQSLESFKGGLKKFFSAYGKNNIPRDDLYIDINTNRSEIRKWTDSYFLYHFLTHWHDEKVSVNLNDCLDKVSAEGFFEIFQAEEILSYHKRNEETDNLLIPILKNYYDKEIKSADFENCLWMEREMFHWRTKEFRLGKIFKKFQFETPENYLMEMIWLDDEGTRGFETAKANNKKSLSQLILERLSQRGTLDFRKRILRNIKSGIKYELVLGTHISLCKHLNITEAKDDILECLKKMKDGYTTKIDTVDIYLALGGNTFEILTIFLSLENYDGYFFYFLSSKLHKLYPTEVTHKLNEALRCDSTKNETKIGLARLLSEIGNIEAFSYLVNQVRIQLKSPYSIQSNRSINAVDTTKALIQLSDIMYMVVDKKFDNNTQFNESAKSIILEWLNDLAAKSEADLMEVTAFLERTMNGLMDKYEAAKDFNWYINQMLEDFRGSDKTIKTVSEIKNILTAVNN